MLPGTVRTPLVTGSRGSATHTNAPKSRRSCHSRRRISDQKRAEEILERMWITPNEWSSRPPIERLTSGAVSCFTNVLRQNNRGDGGADKPGTRYRRRRLIYRDVNFVIGRFRAVGLRNRGDQRHAG